MTRSVRRAEVRRRERKQVVCLEIDDRASDDLVRALTAGTRTRDEDVYRVSGFMSMRDLIDICERVDLPALLYPPFNPRRLATKADIFSIVRERDGLLYRPYDSFTAVIELLHAAATDPAVVAVKQTLYQTDEDSPVIDANLAYRAREQWHQLVGFLRQVDLLRQEAA